MRGEADDRWPTVVSEARYVDGNDVNTDRDREREEDLSDLGRDRQEREAWEAEG